MRFLKSTKIQGCGASLTDLENVCILYGNMGGVIVGYVVLKSSHNVEIITED